MKLWIALVLVALFPVTAGAQGRIVTQDSLRAAAQMPGRVRFRDPRNDWDNVRRLPASSTIVVYTRNVGTKWQFVSADGTGLTVIDVEAAGRPARRIDRSDVSEISRYRGQKGSVVGAIVGAAAGIGLGLYAATAAAHKQCGGGCGDEEALIGVSLIGLPIGGAVLGYVLPGGNRRLETVYIAP